MQTTDVRLFYLFFWNAVECSLYGSLIIYQCDYKELAKDAILMREYKRKLDFIDEFSPIEMK